MPAKERQWTHSQLKAMLTDTHVALNDPYAFSCVWWSKNSRTNGQHCKTSSKNKLDMLLEKYNNA